MTTKLQDLAAALDDAAKAAREAAHFYFTTPTLDPSLQSSETAFLDTAAAHDAAFWAWSAEHKRVHAGLAA